MSAVPKEFKKRYTLEEYLELELAASYKSEYYNGEIWAMAGAALPHSQIVINAGGELRSNLSDGCQVLSSDTQIRIDYYKANVYPDLSVVCGDVEQAGTIGIKNPKLIVEVLSDSTANRDRTTKFKYYRSLASFKEYVLIEQNRPSIQTFYKETDEQGEIKWVSYFFDGIEDTLVIRSIDVKIPLTEIYKNVEFPIEMVEIPTETNNE